MGVTVYVIDTEIRIDHTEFGGGATIGGISYGIAKDATLVAVRVLACNGSGTISGVISGVDWVSGNAIKPAVANMSLVGGFSRSLDTAVNSSITRA